MNKFVSFALLAVSACYLSSCSVAMAAKKEGTDVSKLQQCKTRGQVIAQGGRVVSSERLPNGDLVEVYLLKKERGSTGRAVMHGLLDVSTLGIWEVFGTPMEGYNSKEFFSIKVIYDRQENIKNVFLS